jgi:hypothetical protein
VFLYPSTCSKDKIDRAERRRADQNPAKIRRDALLTATTVRILPTARAGAAAQPDLTETGRLLVRIAVDRALCNGLSERIDLWS